MQKHKPLRYTSLFVGALATSMFPSVLLAHKGGYIGIGIGQGIYSSDITSEDWNKAIRKQMGIDTVTATYGTTSDQEDSAFAYKIYGGYDFNQYWALEGFYIDLGEVEAETSWSGSGFLGLPGGGTGTFEGTTKGKGKVTPKAIGVSALGKLPVTQWFRFYGKLGAFYYRSEFEGNWSAQGSLTGEPYNNGGPQDEVATGVSWLFGLGAGFTVAEHIGLNLEWESYRDLEIEYTGGGSDSYDVNVISASIDYKF